MVDESEAGEYRARGAQKILHSKGLVGARNCALDHAFNEGANCVQVDDDLVKVTLNNLDGKKGRQVSFKAGLSTFLDFAHDCPAKLVGIPPTDNPYFSKGETHQNGFIIGSFMLCKPTHLRFDEKLRLKEDYDYTLQHIKEYGGVTRFNGLLWTFKHYTNEGGAVAVRSTRVEQEMILYLLRKWNGAVRPHPRRENEVVIARNPHRFFI